MSAKHTTLLLLLPLLLGARRCRAWSLSGPPAPRFAVVPASTAREGKGQLDTLSFEAEGEGLLDRLLGTNCFSQAVAELTSDCRRMEQEAKTRLALRLTNCQLKVQGGQTFPCARRQPIRDCTEALSERAHALYVEFLTHADTMCLYIQNQQFEKYTESMLNRLAEGAGFAKEQLAAVAKTAGKLSGDTAALAQKAEATLGMLREHGELEQEALQLQKRARAEATAYFQTLDAKQQLAIELQDAALQKAAALEAAQAATLERLAEARAAVGGVFDLVEGRAAELAAAAGLQADAQRALAAELGALAAGSQGIRSAVDVVIGYQQRSDSALMRLLGKSYTLEDVAFYGAGMLAALATSFSPATARAKLPVLALMGLSLLGERLLMDRLHMFLEVDEAGAVVAALPLPGWLPLAAAAAGQPLRLDLKWVVRRAAAAAGAAILLYCLLSYRDYDRENFRLLQQFEAEQRRRHDDYMALLHRQRLELAALLGGGKAAGGGGGDGSDGLQHGLELGPAGGVARNRGAAAAKGAAPVRQQQQQQQLEQPGVGGGQLVPLCGARPALPAIPESDEEEEEWNSSELQAATAKPPARKLAAAAAGAATPAARERRQAAGARPKSDMLRRVAAAPAAAGRKRGASEEGEATASVPGSSKRRAGGRRSSVTEDMTAIDGAVAEDADAAAGSKRTRRGSASQAATAAKRARRS